MSNFKTLQEFDSAYVRLVSPILKGDSSVEYKTRLKDREDCKKSY